MSSRIFFLGTFSFAIFLTLSSSYNDPPLQINLDRFLALTPIFDPTPYFANLSLPDPAETETENSLSESLPNPIAKDYPTQITGTINASYFVIPITYEEARAAIPAKYPILTHQIKKFWNKKNKYPLVINLQLDHDIQSLGSAIPDFRAAIFRFPFVDVLSNDRTPFTFLATNLLSDDPIALIGGNITGVETIVSSFTPSRDAYTCTKGANRKGPRFIKARPASQGRNVEFTAVFEDRARLGRKELDFWKTLLDQPFLGSPAPPIPIWCGAQYKFYDTVITTGVYAPVQVKGDISLDKGVTEKFPKGIDVRGIEGARFDVAFLERILLDCKDFA